ncbi:MAG TPA: HAMP domain-containing sensor histidine kinase [Candidatus Krumholzibacteria bacterium]|nr:HAMP domain-containing sensor histidine kinase [Candidatus Krumholzibacteria bacterium]HRX51746.1 HAMP domain-containing sensor histidine kinase [Candidatus Krumholzibacteria bacterium]
MNPAVLDLRHERVPVFSLAGLAVLLFFLIQNVSLGHEALAWVDAACLVLVAACYLVFKHTEAGRLASGTGLAFIMTALVLQMHLADPNALLWALIFPIPIFNILGLRPGRIFIGTWWLVVTLYMAFGPAVAEVSPGLKIEVVLCFLVSCVLSHQQELLRERQVHSINSLRQEAQAANLSKDRFLAQVTHELRTPLNAVLGFSQILQERESLTDDDRMVVDKIHTAGSNLLQLVNRVLDFSRLDAGMMAFRPERFRLDELVGEVLLMAEPQALKRGLSVVRDCGPGATVYADRELLRLALTNLLCNAVKFTPRGGVITVFGRRGEGLELGVADTGTGIPSDQVERLFEPFVQLENALEMGAKGTGLGLSIVKMAADLHGADVLVESEPGVGSTFRLRLPASMIVGEGEAIPTAAQPPVLV